MGNINVYSGPMKCGKSHRLIHEATRQKIAGKNIKVFKPLMDTRFSEDSIEDRNGNNFEAINIKNIEEIGKYDADIYFVDEFQFLEGNIDTIQKLVGEGKKFYISGLNLTSERKPFGKMGELLCNADHVEMMTSICECCHEDNAVYSFCKTEKTGDILIGDSQYIPVCASCYEKLSMKEVGRKLENKGVTLISLVITIVILLIISAVSIAAINGKNDLFIKANEAGSLFEQSAKNEVDWLKEIMNSDYLQNNSNTIMQNILTSTVVENSTSESQTGNLQLTSLYPGGTAEQPGKISMNQRVVINNPFPGHRVICWVEIQVNNQWSDPGFIYSANATDAYGVVAKQIVGDNIDAIVVQSGGKGIAAKSSNGGNAFGMSTNVTTATPYRVIVFCLD